MSIDEKINKVKKSDMNTAKSENGNCHYQFHCGIC